MEMEFGDWKKLVVAEPTIGSVVAARGTQCLYVEATKEDIRNSQDILQVANGGTPIILLGRGTVIQDQIDQNGGNGAHGPPTLGLLRLFIWGPPKSVRCSSLTPK